MMHITNSVLLFLIFCHAGSPIRSFFLAGLFALHPLHVESVVWISERKDVLSTMFFLITILAYFKYVNNKSIVQYGLIFLGLCLGLMAKAMLVTLPFVLLLLDIWPLERALTGPKDNRKSFKIGKIHLAYDVFLEKLPLLIPVILFSFVSIIAQKSVGAFFDVTLGTRLANCFVSYISYIGHFFWPINLALFYPYNPVPLWRVLVYSAIVFIISIFAVKTIKKAPFIFMGWFWYLGTLIPVIGLVQVGGQAMADRYTYIPSIGFFIILVWGLYDILNRIENKNRLFSFSAIVILIVLCGQTFIQVSYWRDNIVLYTHASKITKNNYKAHSLLAWEYFKRGDIDQALENCLLSIQMAPRYTTAYINLANIYEKKGDFESAITSLKNAISIEPDNIVALGNLGIAYQRQGKLKNAVSCFDKAIKTNKKDDRSHYLMANVLVRLERTEDAVYHYKEALKINAKYEPALYELGEIMLIQGKKRFSNEIFQ